MQAKDVMYTDLHTCTPNQSLHQAAKIMRNENCGSIPVVKQDNSKILCGMLTDRDICMSALYERKRLEDIHVEDAMSNEIVSCNPDDTLSEIGDLMKKHKLLRLPVVNNENELCGLFSLTHIATLTADPAGGPVGDLDAIPYIIGNIYASVSYR